MKGKVSKADFKKSINGLANTITRISNSDSSGIDHKTVPKEGDGDAATEPHLIPYKKPLRTH